MANQGCHFTPLTPASASLTPATPTPVPSLPNLVKFDEGQPNLVFPESVLLADSHGCATACATLIDSVAALGSSLSVSYCIEYEPRVRNFQARLEPVAWFDTAVHLVESRGLSRDLVIEHARQYVNATREQLRLASLEIVDPSQYLTTLVEAYCTNIKCNKGRCPYQHTTMALCPGELRRKESTRSCGWAFANELHITASGWVH